MKKIWKVIVIAVICAAAVLEIINYMPKKLFADIEREDVESIIMQDGIIKSRELNAEEIDTVVEALQELEVTSITLEFNASSGTWKAVPAFVIHMKDGEQISFTSMPQHFYYQEKDTDFRCDSEANEVLYEMIDSYSAETE